MAERKRELIDTGTDKRFVRRDETGRSSESDDVRRSLAKDVKTAVNPGQGEEGDRKRKELGRRVTSLTVRRLST